MYIQFFFEMTEVDPFANANPFATGSGGLARTPPGL